MMDKDEWQSNEAKEYLNRIYKDLKVFINKYNGIADSMNIVDKNNIIKAARDKKIREGGAAIERISFNEWIRYIDCFD
jgi:hypothetical protein